MRSPEELLREAKTIALVGASPKPDRPTAGAKGLWLQPGLTSPEARAIAAAAGMDYVEDECTAIVYRRLA
ncbi:MAG: CoA-binding protein [Gaiellaceae bacterium]